MVEIFSRIKKNYPSYNGPGVTSYQYTKNGDVMGPLSQKSVTCDDSPCSVQRLQCECDKVFALANTMEFEAGKARLIFLKLPKFRHFH